MFRFLQLFFILSLLPVHAQFENQFSFGPRLGVNYSQLSGLEGTIYPEDFWDKSTFSFEDQGRIGPALGLFINYKTEDFKWAFQSELGFAMQGTKTEYKQPAGTNSKGTPYDALNYDLELNYSYLTFGGLMKYYPYRGLNVGVGSQLGINLNPKNVIYQSDFDYMGTGSDLQVQEELSKSITGTTVLVSLLANIGYEFPFGLGIEARYGYGLNDAVEVSVNDNDWVETSNTLTFYQFLLSYRIPFR